MDKNELLKIKCLSAKIVMLNVKTLIMNSVFQR